MSDELKKITVWERFYEPSSDGKTKAHYEHNHIVDGWDLSGKPRSYYREVDNDWSKWEWRKTFTYLKNGVVINIDLNRRNPRTDREG